MTFFTSFFRASALKALHGLDDARLTDLDLNRRDLFDAQRTGGNATAYLNARRAERAGMC